MDILGNTFQSCLFIFLACFFCCIIWHVSVVKTPKGMIGENMSPITKFVLGASFWVGVISGAVWSIAWIWS